MLRSIVVLFWLAVSAAWAQSPSADREMRVGLYRERPVSQVIVMTARGTSSVLADGVRKGELRANDGLRIELSGGSIIAKSLAFTVTAKKIEVVPNGGGFRMRALDRKEAERTYPCLLYTSPSPRDRTRSRMPSSA